MITPNAPPSSPDNFRHVAVRLAGERGWFLTDQFRNPANVRVHEDDHRGRDPGPDRRQGGRLRGRRRHRRDHHRGRPAAQGRPAAVSASSSPIRSDRRWPTGSRPAGWARTAAYAVEGIGGSEAPENLHRDVIDAAERVSDADSFSMVKLLVRAEGLLVGGSAGTNVVAALRVAAAGGLDGPVVTVLPDAWDRYRTQPWMHGWDPA